MSASLGVFTERVASFDGLRWWQKGASVGSRIGTHGIHFDGTKPSFDSNTAQSLNSKK